MSQEKDISTPPPSVSGFIIQERLGSGSYATVYRGYSQVLDSSLMTRETVAIKCMKRAIFRKYKSAIDNLLLEIGILKKLSHKHIVQLNDFKWDSNYIYLILEYCAGGDLSRFLARHVRLDERVTQRFLQQLASALQYLRDRDICHMDLKPKNILIDNRAPPYTLKLADFGFAMILSDTEHARSKRGSPLYMAPEMFRAKSYDARVDLWSLGVILYECLFGKAPFAAPSVEEVEKRITSKEPIEFPSDPQLTVPCFDLISLLLIRDPNHRITYPEFFDHPFVDLEHGPTEESMTKAVEIAKGAVDADRGGDTQTAIKLYCECIDYFLPHLSVIASAQAKLNLRTKINSYVRRAEALKTGMRPLALSRPGTGGSGISPPNSLTNESTGKKQDLSAMWTDVPEVGAALMVISVANDLLTREQFDKALEKYTLAIESMLKLLQQHGAEKGSPRLEILRRELSKWMKTAERIKEYLSTEVTTTAESVARRIDDQVFVDETQKNDSQCRLQ